jgi:hypothetical protein
VQVIAEEVRVELNVEDLSGLAESEREAAAERHASEEARRPFDLAHGPLLRVRLLRLSAEDHVVLFTMHHIISDGWSMGVLMRELGALYEAFTSGEPSPLAELPIQYADYAVWQRAWLSGEVLERQLEYWRQHLAGAPAVSGLPTDRPRPAERTFHGARQSAVLSAELTESLHALSRREGVTLFMLLFAALNSLLHYRSGSEDLVVGTDLANRNRREVEGLIGFFINQLPLRTNLSGDPTFREVLQRVRGVALGAYAHEHVSLDRLVEVLKVERNLQYSPLYQVNFTLQNTPGPSPSLRGLTVSAVPMDMLTAQLDLTLNFAEIDKTLIGAFDYDTDLYDAATIQQLARDFTTVLSTVADSPEIRLSELKATLAEQNRRHRLAQAEEVKDGTRRKLAGRLRSAAAARAGDAGRTSDEETPAGVI